MNNQENNSDKFNYTYSAPTENERREIEGIKRQYAPVKKHESGLELLRALNKRVTRVPLIVSVILGVTGTLTVGLGMTMVMEWNLMLWGIIVGVAGFAVAAAAYPVYKALLARNKREYGQQIIDLSNELLNSEEEI